MREEISSFAPGADLEGPMGIWASRALQNANMLLVDCVLLQTGNMLQGGLSREMNAVYPTITMMFFAKRRHASNYQLL